jgi:hypothetical protein
MSPLVIFDARHGWNNFAAMKRFFTERQTTVSARPWTAIPEIPDIAFETNLSLVGAGNANLAWIFTYGTLLMLGVVYAYKLLAKRDIKFLNKKFWINTGDRLNKSYLSEVFLITVWLLTAYIGLGLYKQHIYDHYFGFFFAAPFLLLAAVLKHIFDNYGRWAKVFIGVLVIYAVVVNLNNNPLKHPPNRQMQRTIEVAEKIRDEAGGQPLNLAVIAERNYEDAYQYFLEKWETGVTDINPENTDETITDQLFVVCEFGDKGLCDPTHNPKAEVANFGWSKIDGEWEVSGIHLFKLVHTNL